MLFRKKHPKSCTYCVYGTRLNDDEVLCVKRGVVASIKKCRKFSYEPFKRVPPKIKTTDFSKYDKEDFTL